MNDDPRRDMCDARDVTRDIWEGVAVADIKSREGLSRTASQLWNCRRLRTLMVVPHVLEVHFSHEAERSYAHDAYDTTEDLMSTPDAAV